MVRKTTRALLFAFLFTAASVALVDAQISYSSGTYTQNFDSIGTSATATLPTGWKVDKQTTVRTLGTYSGAGTQTEFTAGNSMSPTAQGGIYNYAAGAAATATDRAVGFLSTGSSTQSGNLYVAFTNTGADPITNFTIGYNVEKYRTGTNSAGFSIQMYYSTNGTTWINAGSNFLTTFGADATTAGYASAPGDTRNVLATLTQTVPVGASLYLAWNYSVTTGTTTTNAQALGLDNFTFAAVPEPSTWAMMIAGAGVLGVTQCLRRKRR